MNVIKLLRGPALGHIAKFITGAGLIRSAVTKALEGIAEEIKEGKTWKGPSADMFLAVLTDDHINSSRVIVEQLETMHGNYIRSIELIDQADAKNQTRINSLGENFGNVFR